MESSEETIIPAPIAPKQPETSPANGKYTVEEATNKIRQLVEDLKNNGINIKADEMNFGKTYQVILKIDKDQQ